MDFYQDVITTIHRLAPRFDQVVVDGVRDAAGERPCALVVPMLLEEMDREALDGIARALSKATYLHEIIVAVTAESAAERDKVARYFGERDVTASILWCEDPAIKAALDGLTEEGLEFSRYSGKGIAVWTALGAAALDNYAVALHDADIETYDPALPARLLYPIANPDLDFFFSKGYYGRVSEDRLYGRVVRLYVWPLLDAWLASSPTRSHFARYLRSFRYPLAGEFALTTDLALNLRIPTDWGLEMGVLGEVYRNASPKRLCQVDLGLYSHKHQTIGRSTAEGLQRMVHDLTTTFFRTVTEVEASVIDAGSLLRLRVLYRRMAQDAIRKYAVDAAANGFLYARHTEERAVETFARIVQQAGEAYMKNPGETQIPDWLRVRSVREDLPEVVRSAAVPSKKQRKRVAEAARASMKGGARR